MNEATSEKRLSTAEFVERAERPDDRVAGEAFAEQREDQRIGEPRENERIGEQMGDRMGESPDEAREAERASARHNPGARIDERVAQAVPAGQPEDDTPMELFESGAARGFRERWDVIQIGFVDDPGKAVREADELVAQVMSRLAETFANQRSELERYVTGDSTASTERMRVALRRYRSFFQRLLTL